MFFSHHYFLSGWPTWNTGYKKYCATQGSLLIEKYWNTSHRFRALRYAYEPYIDAKTPCALRLLPCGSPGWCGLITSRQLHWMNKNCIATAWHARYGTHRLRMPIKRIRMLINALRRIENRAVPAAALCVRILWQQVSPHLAGFVYIISGNKNGLSWNRFTGKIVAAYIRTECRDVPIIFLSLFALPRLRNLHIEHEIVGRHEPFLLAQQVSNYVSYLPYNHWHCSWIVRVGGVLPLPPSRCVAMALISISMRLLDADVPRQRLHYLTTKELSLSRNGKQLQDMCLHSSYMPYVSSEQNTFTAMYLSNAEPGNILLHM